MTGIARLRRDDSCSHDIFQDERQTDRQHLLTDLDLVRVPHAQQQQILVIDLQQRDIGTRIGTHDLGLELTLVRQRGIVIADGIYHNAYWSSHNHLLK